MSVETDAEMVTIPKAEYEALKTEVRRYRIEEGDRIAAAQIEADPYAADGRTFTRQQLAEMIGVND